MSKSINDQVFYASLAALIFAIVSLPNVYNYTNSIFNGISVNNCPTSLGKLVHGIIFLVLNFIVMKWTNSRKPESERKPDSVLLKWAIYGTLLFYLVADSDIYLLTSEITKTVSGGSLQLANSVGCPNGTGVLVHSLVYMGGVLGLMQLPEDIEYSYY